MSLTSWKSEFYPVDAADVAADSVSDVHLLEHSIRKWEGRLPQNLERHGLAVDKFCRTDIVEQPKGDLFIFGSQSCSLCRVYSHFEQEVPCGDCPIVKLTGRKCFESEMYDSNEGYYIQAYKMSPVILIIVLQQALAMTRKHMKQEQRAAYANYPLSIQDTPTSTCYTTPDGDNTYLMTLVYTDRPENHWSQTVWDLMRAGF